MKTLYYSLFAFSLITALSRCQASHSKQNNTMESTSPHSATCEEVWQRIIQKDFVRWNGLPVACDLKAIVNQFTASHATTRAHFLGLQTRRAYAKVLQIPGYQPGRTKVWFSEDGQVIKIALELTLEDKARQTLLEALGTPTAKLAVYQTPVDTVNVEWVYPKKGITLFNYDKVITEVLLYPPIDLTTYKNKIYYSEPPREFLESDEEE